MYRIYIQDGEGVFLQVGEESDLDTAIAACPAGGHVEEVTEAGSQVVYL